MKLFNKVAIIGTGLIGGSIALAIKRRRLANRVIGLSRRKKTLIIAKKIKAIDEARSRVSELGDVDLVVLATPVGRIIELAPQLIKVIKKDCIVSDVGSTKQLILSRLSRNLPNYVGTHPLAGSQNSGIVFARADLFEGSTCIITPGWRMNSRALVKITLLWRRLGARVVYLNAAEHDRALSMVSHLPHVLAYSLMTSVGNKYLKYAASGLRDTTRIAASDPYLWADIFLSNRENMLKAIDLFGADLADMRQAIEKRDKRKLISIMEKARDKREKLENL